MEQNLMHKKKAIMVSLASIAENFSKIVTPELNQIWCEALKPLSFDQIAEGTRRCLLECEYFPPILKAPTNNSAPSSPTRLTS